MDKKSIYLAFFLAVVGMVSTGLIASVNSATEPVIAKRIQVEKEETIKDFFPASRGFEELEVTDPNYSQVKVSYKVVDDASNVIGYIYEIVANGYGGTVTALVSYDLNTDELSNLKYIGKFSETPGFGTRVKEAEFLDQVVNKKANEMKIDTLSGATITSSAVKGAIDAANAYYLEHK